MRSRIENTVRRSRTKAMLSLFCALVCGGLAIGARADQVSSRPVDTDLSHVGWARQTYTYKSVAGCDIKADVYRLPGGEVRPAIIWLHGGALIFGGRGMVRPDQLGRYLRAGYAVVSIDYRLAPETKLPAIVEDVQDAYRWVREKGPALFSVDPDRIALVGHSAGGYLALMAGLSVTPRPKAIVSFYGYGDIAGEWYGRPDPHFLMLDKVSRPDAYKAVGGRVLSESPVSPRIVFYNYLRQNGLWPNEVAGLDPDSGTEKLYPFCPARRVTRKYPPTLLLHGDKDTDVPFEESVRMAAALKRHHVPHRLIVMKNYGHVFDVFPAGLTPDAGPIGLKDPKVAAAYDSVVVFLKKHIGR